MKRSVLNNLPQHNGHWQSKAVNGVASLGILGCLCLEANPAFGAESAKKIIKPSPVLTLATSAKELKTVSFQIVKTIPRKQLGFTQGLVVLEPGYLAESVGLYGKSAIRRVETQTGMVTHETKLDPKFFGEGLAPIDSKGTSFIQLTWQERKALQWTWNKAKGWQLDRTIPIDFEGWGLAPFSSSELVASNGSSDLLVLDKTSLAVKRRIPVTMLGIAQSNLNELEMIDNHLFANRWMTQSILKIDPTTGHVVGLLDMSSLPEKGLKNDPDSVLNGLAWDPLLKRLYVTGKNWRNIYVLRLL
jgi:glutamine cyclotransferase